MKKLYLHLVVLLLSIKAYADEPRYTTSFNSQNGQYQLRLVDTKYEKAKSASVDDNQTIIETTWGLFEKATKQRLYTISGEFSSKTAYISDDGKTIVIVDDWSPYSPEDNLVVLSFYKNGNIAKEYQLGNLLCSTYNISRSVSHFNWFFDLDFSSNKSVLSLKTYELNTFTFDISSGKLLKKELHPAVTNTSLLVYGEVKKIGKDLYELEVCHCVFGKVPENGKIRFNYKDDLQDDVWNYITVLVDEDKLVSTGYPTMSWILNECSYALEKSIQDATHKSINSEKRKIRKCL